MQWEGTCLSIVDQAVLLAQVPFLIRLCRLLPRLQSTGCEMSCDDLRTTQTKQGRGQTALVAPAKQHRCITQLSRDRACEQAARSSCGRTFSQAGCGCDRRCRGGVASRTDVSQDCRQCKAECRNLRRYYKSLTCCPGWATANSFLQCERTGAVSWKRRIWVRKHLHHLEYLVQAQPPATPRSAHNRHLLNPAKEFRYILS